ncbi:hypothetical protein QAD02_006355 [Eretmocerus hayati]|uniref:Uncharacterized protein n=1 Tax=Eretmocerus hayati TaxID=131215 RepID=A0ACC2N140_9HYME|nr:hypothetical protein QAD02_006355 [Eretmocerus hayati]
MSHTLTQRELDLRARRDEIEANAPDWHQLFLTDYRATTAANEQRFEAIEKKNDCILRALSQTDENEIKISGIPTGLNVPLIQSAVRLLQEIGLTSPSNFILDHREWPAKENESHQSIIVKLVGGVRETVLRNASKLKGKTAQSIFGSGGNTRIYINQVYPRHVYKLLREARVASKSLNYAYPLVKNMIVFMRETRDSDLILIKDSADITRLRPRIIQPTSPTANHPDTSMTQ